MTYNIYLTVYIAVILFISTTIIQSRNLGKLSIFFRKVGINSIVILSLFICFSILLQACHRTKTNCRKQAWQQIEFAKKNNYEYKVWLGHVIDKSAMHVQTMAKINGQWKWLASTDNGDVIVAEDKWWWFIPDGRINEKLLHPVQK